MKSATEEHDACLPRISVILRRWRAGGKRKMAYVAGKLGMATSTWENWEKGRNLPMGRNLFLVAEHTGIPAHCLLCPKVERCSFSSECPSRRP